MSDAPICVHCRKQCSSCFEITRVDSHGAKHGPVIACSIVCLVQWAYTYSTMQGARMAYGAKSAFDNLVSTLKGIGK